MPSAVVITQPLAWSPSMSAARHETNVPIGACVLMLPSFRLLDLQDEGVLDLVGELDPDALGLQELVDRVHAVQPSMPLSLNPPNGEL